MRRTVLPAYCGTQLLQSARLEHRFIDPPYCDLDLCHDLSQVQSLRACGADNSLGSEVLIHPLGIEVGAVGAVLE